MDELIASGELFKPQTDSPFLMATVDDIAPDGVSISINGGLEKLQKTYSYLLTGRPLQKNERVLVAKVSGTYIILAAIA